MFSTMINFGMLCLLQRIHRLHIQLALQMDSSEEISFPRLAKHKTQKLLFDVAEITNEKIFDAIQKGRSL